MKDPNYIFLILLWLLYCGGDADEYFEAQLMQHGFLGHRVAKAIITEDAKPACTKTTYDFAAEISQPLNSLQQILVEDGIDTHLSDMIRRNSAIYHQMVADLLATSCRDLYIEQRGKRFVVGVAATVSAASRIYTDYHIRREIEKINKALSWIEKDWSWSMKEFVGVTKELMKAAHRNELETEILARLSLVMERINLALHDLFEEQRLPVFTNASEIIQIFGDTNLGTIYRNDPGMVVHMATARPLRCSSMTVHVEVCLPVLTSEAGVVYEIGAIGSFETGSPLFVTPLLNYSFVFVHEGSNNPHPIDISQCETRGLGLVCQKHAYIETQCSLIVQGSSCRAQVEEAPARFTKFLHLKTDVILVTREKNFTVMKGSTIVNSSQFPTTPFIGKIDLPSGQTLVVGDKRLQGSGSRLSLSPIKVADVNIEKRWEKYIYGSRNFTAVGTWDGRMTRLDALLPDVWEVTNETAIFFAYFKSIIIAVLVAVLALVLLWRFVNIFVC